MIREKNNPRNLFASALLFVIATLLSLNAFAGDRYLGTIAASTTSKNQSTTAVPFTIPPLALLSIQCDADAFVAVNSSTAVATTSVKIIADQLFQTSLGAADQNVSIILASGTTNCRIFERNGKE